MRTESGKCIVRAAFLFILVQLAIAAGCGPGASPAKSGGAPVTLAAQPAGGAEDASGAGQTDLPASPQEGDVVDLTILSSTMVYSEVYNMMTEPGPYVGKTVKMAGPLYYDYDKVENRYYFAVLIQDATACCAQGMEVVMAQGEYSFPEDLPEEAARVVVTGVFDTFEDGGEVYCYVRDGRFELES